MFTTGSFVTQLIENPNYFKKATPMPQENAWEHWEQALPLLMGIGAVIVLLIAYKIINKYFLSKTLKKSRR